MGLLSLLAGALLAVPAGAIQTPLESYIAQGDTLFAEEHYEEAYEQYNKAVRSWFSREGLKPRSKALARRASALVKIGGKKKLQRALTDCRLAIELDKSNDQAWAAQGMAKMYLNDADGALKSLQRAIKYAPANHRHHNNAGYVLYLKKQYKQATKQFTKAIQLAPKDPLPYVNRGECLSWLKKHDAARDDFDRAIELNEDFGLAYYLRQFVNKAQDLAEAEELDRSKSLRLSPRLEEKGAYKDPRYRTY